MKAVSQEMVQKVSQIAGQNTELYDSYQRTLREQETEIRRLQKQLLKHKGGGKMELLAETQHSHTTLYSEGDDDPTETEFDDSSTSSPDTDAGLLYGVTSKLLHKTPTAEFISKNLHNLRFVAAEKFQLPFGH